MGMHRRASLHVLILVGVLCVAGPAAASGSTARETKVHLDKPDALAQVFPEADQVVELRHLLSKDELKRIEARMDRRLEEGGFYLYVGLAAGKPIGYAAIVSHIGKVKPITHIVGVTPAGEVSEVAVMIYRESHGDEVADRRFMAQYRGKTLEDPIRIDRDIINIAGATLSGRAICNGVRKALAVVHEVFLARDQKEILSLLGDAETVTPAALSTPKEDADATSGVRREREIMGTVCTVHAFGEPGSVDRAALEAAVDATLDEIAHWDDVLSNWRTDTPLSRANSTPVGEPYTGEADLLAWLDDASRWSEATHGHFDPGVG